MGAALSVQLPLLTVQNARQIAAPGAAMGFTWMKGTATRVLPLRRVQSVMASSARAVLLDFSRKALSAAPVSSKSSSAQSVQELPA